MVRGTVVLSLFAAACAAQSSGSAPGAAAAAAAAAAPIVPGAYIVEYEDGQDDLGAFKKDIAKDADVKMDLRFRLFKGASIRFHDQDHLNQTVEKVAAMPAVKRIWPVRRYKIPDYTVEWSGGPSDAQSRGLARRQGPSGNDTFEPHVMTQVNELRDMGIRGKGIKVAVIDSGIDYKHPALGGCFGPGCLVSFGYDLVGDKYNGSNTPVPDPDPMDCGGHGTHVAGIIAAQTNNPYGIIGAATDVTLGMYRVFGCDGSASNDVLIKAYNMAYEAGADLITASIGGSSGWSEDPWAVVVSRIVEMGVPCTVAAGNEGATGQFYASGAADGKRVTAVASFDNVVTPSLLTDANYTVDGGAVAPFGFAGGSPGAWAGVTLPLFAISFDTTDPANGCNPLPADTPDLTNFIVLVRRGTCSFVQKATNVNAKGGRYIIYYNNVPVGSPVTDITAVAGIVAAAGVDAKTGAAWVAALKDGKKITLSMADPVTAPKSLVVGKNGLTGGYASTYTTWGPTFEAEVKPQVAAPGGNILSTYPLAKGGYASLSGTSMATPLMAGVYALIMNIRKTKDPKEIENVLSSTAKPVMFNDGTSVKPFLAPVIQQGAGLIQAKDAAYATTLLSVSSISFNDTANFQPTQNFSISNTGRTAVTYTLSNRGAGTSYTFSDGKLTPDVFPMEIVTNYASMAFSEATFTIPAGGRKLVSVTATPPAGIDASRLPVWSGYVNINGSDGSALSLPYMGVEGSIYSHVTLDPEATYLASFRPSVDDDRDSAPPPPQVAANQTFVLPPRGQSNNTLYDSRVQFPRLSVKLPFGTPLIMIDLVPLSVCGGNANTTDNLGVQSVGQLFQYPIEYQSRQRFYQIFDGLLQNGEYAAPGLYKMVIRTLRVFGDRKKASDYDTVETVPFRIRYLKA